MILNSHCKINHFQKLKCFREPFKSYHKVSAKNRER